MSKILVGAIILMVLGVTLIYMSTHSASITGEVVLDNGVKSFTLTGENFKFVLDGKDNPDIVVNEGDTVRVEFSSTQGFHDWVVDEFSVATEKVRDTDEGTFVEFVADKKGTFEYYCSVGKHRENGMKGNLIVK